MSNYEERLVLRNSKKEYPKPKLEWHSGPPPSIGWWPASRMRNPGALRWWNGKYWSAVCYRDFSRESIDYRLSIAGPMQKNIKWTARPSTWPKRSMT